MDDRTISEIGKEVIPSLTISYPTPEEQRFIEGLTFCLTRDLRHGMSLTVIGTDTIPLEELQTFLKTHGKKLEILLGLVFMEKWFQGRGYESLLMPTPGISFVSRLLTRLLIRWMRIDFQILGMKLFEERY